MSAPSSSVASRAGRPMAPRGNGLVAAARVGVVYGILAYSFWGLVPIYFKVVARVPALEVLAHRVVWSAFFLVAFSLWRNRRRDLAAVWRDRGTMLTLVATTLLIATNWYTFIWAVAHDHILQASLGYYVNPLVNVSLGFFFLRERLRPAQRLAVALAAAGVLYLGVSYRQVPYIALTLALSFGFYGLLRKTVRADALVGLTIETVLLLPLAAAFMTIRHESRTLVFLHGVSRLGMAATQARALDWLLVAAGLVTALPLLWYANAVRRLRLATIGFLQYISPSLQFLLAVVAFGEPLGRANAIAFACIWTALAIYSVDTLRATRAGEGRSRTA